MPVQCRCHREDGVLVSTLHIVAAVLQWIEIQVVIVPDCDFNSGVIQKAFQFEFRFWIFSHTQICVGYADPKNSMF